MRALNVGATYFEFLGEKLTRLQRHVKWAWDALGYALVQTLVNMGSKLHSMQMKFHAFLESQATEENLHRIMLWHKVALALSFIGIAIASYIAR